MNAEQKEELKKHTLLGMPGAGGRGMGRPVVIDFEKKVVKPEKVDEDKIEEQTGLVGKGFEELAGEFENLKELSDEEDVVQVIESQIQVLKDPELRASIRSNIEEKKFKAVYAIFSSFNDYIQLFQNAKGQWVKDRTIDIVSIRDQLIDIVRNKQPEDLDVENAIIFAEELSPTEMIKLSHSDLAGIVIQSGGLTSHVVILAQSLGIPCVIGVKWKRMHPERFQYAIIDGDVGSVLFEPTAKMKEEYEEYKKEKIRQKNTALRWASRPDQTKCGSSFTIRGNVEFASEFPRIKTHGAHGIGLLRTEMILFETGGMDIGNQIEFYRQAAEAASPEPVIIRLFDAGGDKLPENHEVEHNPFLGWRGIRMLLDKPKLLRLQFEAILRVSAEFEGGLKILVPMISHLEQIDAAKSILEEVKADLNQKNITYDRDIPFGIMIEVPGIALMAEEAAEKVDFFSIGTNDLTQYMLAVDRGNGKISSLYQPAHPSVWRIIKHVITASQRAAIPVSVCGEMASNPLFAACFLGMGLNDLSMTTNSIPAVKQMLCSHELEDFKIKSELILKSQTFSDVNLIFNEWKKTLNLNYAT